MVEFGKKLQTSIAKGRQDWSSYYIHYDRLKDILKKFKKVDKLQHRRSLSFSHRPHYPRALSFTTGAGLLSSSSAASSLFRHALDQEIEKVVLFLLRQQGQLAKSLAHLNLQREACQQAVTTNICTTSTTSTTTSTTTVTATTSSTAWSDNVEDIKLMIQTLTNDYRAMGHLILEFIAYVEINVTAVRKILKKHDKTFAADGKLSEVYIRKFTSHDDSHLDQLYNYGGLSALMVTMEKAFAELHLMEVKVIEYTEQNNNNNNKRSSKRGADHRRIQSDPTLLAYSTSQSDDDGEDNDGEDKDDFSIMRLGYNNSNSNNNDQKLLSIHSCKCSITSNKEPVLNKIHAARSRLKHSTKYVQVVAAQALMMFDDDDDEDDSKTAGINGENDDTKEETRAQRISSWINLCSTFLYMTNYYIVAPTSGQYADKLGSTEAMAGIIIGMTPNAALIATVLYGWWSNHSYKSALIFAAACSWTGNVFYALALRHNSLTYVMIGRFLNGFGSARSINRRFIADTYSRSERTAASAAFVTAGALGMAVGPAIAAILGKCEFPQDSQLFTVETTPGWVMMTLWSCFFVAAIFLFEEPDRTGLYGPSNSKNKNNSKEDEEAIAVENSETQPLLLVEKPTTTTPTPTPTTTPAQPPLYKNVPVMMTLWIYFVLKLALECLLSSSATVTKLYFGWNAQHTGTFLAFLGLLMFPANMVVARLSHRYEDRELLYATLIIMLFSVLGIFVYEPSHYSALQYVIFGICVFLSANCLEGPNMSLLSKTIPKSWAKGTFNSGFLATEAGTAARSVGDVMISAAAALMGFEKLLNTTFLPLMVFIIISIVLFRHFFEFMIEEEEDDDDTAEETIQSRAQSFEDAMNEQLKEIE